ncbi:MAG TPA: mechanosensitive ion channel domain-containing protein [Polyangiaceae bacterium]|nr:mechanosensitive ion channel domain-containing protein [Polyangiaceae bacterium]
MKELLRLVTRRVMLGLLLFAMGECVSPGALAEPPAAPSAASVEAPVLVYNRPIVVLRSSFLGVSAPERARHTTQRLDQVLARIGAGKISVAPTAGANAVLVDGSLALFVTPGDVDAIDGETLEQTTQNAVKALERVIAETREARDRERLWRALATTGAATLALFVLCFLVLRVRSWLERRFIAFLRGSASRLSGAGSRLLYTERLLRVSHWLVQTAAACLLLLATYRWTSFVLNQFPYTRAWGEDLDDFLVGAAAQIGGSVVRALPDLLIALVIFVLARGLIGLVRPLFDGIERRRTDVGWLDADTAKATRRLFSLAVWVFAGVMAYPYLPGSSSAAFKGMSVLIGVMVTLGGSSLFGQAASGLILLYSRTLRLGEFVRVGEHEGTVTELGVFTTRIATGRGEDVSLPNAWVLATVTKNYSRPANGRGYMFRAEVTIGYDAPWRQVEAMLLEAARATEGVSGDPAPRVYQTRLSDFYVEYTLVCHASFASADDRARASAALNASVIDTFNRYGVQIMSPHYLGDPAQRKTIPVDGWHAAPAASDGRRQGGGSAG